MGDEVVHAVDASQEGAFAAAAGADDGGDGLGADVHGDVFDAGLVAVVKGELFGMDDGGSRVACCGLRRFGVGVLAGRRVGAEDAHLERRLRGVVLSVFRYVGAGVH